jgi:hypothetical protein
MNLPENLTFSQHNLQDYVDCRYRFYLKYVLGVEWPAIENEPILLQEARMELGNQFHRLVQQYFAGVDPGVLASTIDSDELSAWWQAFMALGLYDLPGDKQAEKLYSIPLADHRLVAKYDLLIRQTDGAYTIYDWKTSSRPPSQAILMNRLQSIVYPFVLQTWWSSRADQSATPANLEMIYWFPTQPAEPVQFTYSAAQLDNDRDYLQGIVNEITSSSEEWFEKTAEVKKCAFCRYRSLCDRGISAGNLSNADVSEDAENVFDLDFDAL